MTAARFPLRLPRVAEAGPMTETPRETRGARARRGSRCARRRRNGARTTGWKPAGSRRGGAEGGVEAGNGEDERFRATSRGGARRGGGACLAYAPGGIFTYTVALSGSGRYAAFPSAATNLVEGGTTGPQHVYVRDRKEHVTMLLSLGPADVQGDDDSPEAALSKSGKTVAFNSSATNLVADDVAGLEDVFVRRW